MNRERRMSSGSAPAKPAINAAHDVGLREQQRPGEHPTEEDHEITEHGLPPKRISFYGFGISENPTIERLTFCRRWCGRASGFLG